MCQPGALSVICKYSAMLPAQATELYRCLSQAGPLTGYGQAPQPALEARVGETTLRKVRSSKHSTQRSSPAHLEIVMSVGHVLRVI